MRIIGGHDYYDNALAFGRDEDIVFVRGKSALLTSEEVTSRFFIPAPFLPLFGLQDAKGRIIGWSDGSSKVRLDDTDLWITPVLVVVAGVQYAGIRIADDRSPYYYNGLTPIGLKEVMPRNDVCWTIDQLVHTLQRHGLTAAFDKKPRPSFFRADAERTVDIHAWFDPAPLTGVQKEHCIESRVAVLTYDLGRDRGTLHQDNSRRWRLNGDDLKDLQFMKRMEPWTLFQELSMWIGGVLPRSANPIVQITDDQVKIAKHGFDKMSFRKCPAAK